jgi:archaemetzincin
MLVLASLGGVDEDILAAAEERVRAVFGLPVRRMREIPIPAGVFDAQRNQHSSVLTMKALIGVCPPDALRFLVITACDLFIPMLSFVFGQAQLDGKIALVSVARLRQEFYGLPANRELMLSRLTKEVVHEVGHTFGLVHCLDTSCPMSLSTGIRQVDGKGTAFCGSCSVLVREQVNALRTAVV